MISCTENEKIKIKLIKRGPVTLKKKNRTIMAKESELKGSTN